METPEAILKLFDSFWFELNILKKNTSSSTSTTCIENQKNESSEEPKLTKIRTIHTRSMSDQSSITSFNNDSLSPNSVLITSKLQTILSGKEVTDSEHENENPQPENLLLLPKKNIMSGKGKKKRESKSLSDLEFEELKGFMDLGFVFSEEDKDSSLASIIPGLQRLGKKDEEREDVNDDDDDDDDDEFVVQRPYLSEAWEVHEENKKKENPLLNWKVPAINNETDMKNTLRWWAHTVASTVR